MGLFYINKYMYCVKRKLKPEEKMLYIYIYKHSKLPIVYLVDTCAHRCMMYMYITYRYYRIAGIFSML